MPPGPSNESIEEAQKALDSIRSYNVSEGEKVLNATGDKVLAVSNSKHVALAKDVASNVDFSVVKEQVSNFVENCKILMNVLDDIGKVHPFVQAAVVVFKAGIQLELTRRENDDRVLALNVTMCDMMSTLGLLKKIPSPHEQCGGVTVEDRLHGRLNDVVQSIKDCAKLCDSYQRRHAAVKFFTSLKWQSKFTSVAEQFVDHQKAIQSDLQLYIAFEISAATSILSTLNRNVATVIETVFERMQPSKDRDIAAFVQSKGGRQAGDPDDQLLKDVIKYEQQLQRKDEKGIVNPKGGPQQHTEMLTTLDKFKEELKKDIDIILKENTELFEKRFDAVEFRLKEVKGVIIRESDRVIETILAGVGQGPQERIRDRDVYRVWREMGWKGSVKATYLVMALHDHFIAKSRDSLAEIHAIAEQPDRTSADEKLDHIASIAKEALPATPAEDLWSLKFITLRRIQPLIEALDEDGSSHITVNEVNAFTASRPEGWRWIAYWTAGFEMTTHWYYRRICRLLSLITRSSKRVQPANRRAASELLGHWSINTLQNHLSGFQRTGYWESIDWDEDYVFSKFKDWVVETENKMEEILDKLVYYIDQDNTLNTVTGGGRPEKFMMPLFYLLLKRCYSIMEKAHHVVLDSMEFQMLETSLAVVHLAIQEPIYTIQNIKKEKKLRNIFFGLYTYTFDDPEEGEFWTRDVGSYDDMADDPVNNSDTKAKRELYFEPLPKEDLDRVDLSSSLKSPAKDDELAESERDVRSLVGVWSGSGTHSSLTQMGVGPFSFSIAQLTSDNRFHCSGVDMWGPFSINGCLNGDQILFLKMCEARQEVGFLSNSWRYQGVFNEEQMTISGKWGYRLYDKEEESLLEGSVGCEARDAGMETTAPNDGDKDASVAVISVDTRDFVHGEEESPPTHDDSVSEDSGSADGWLTQGDFILNRRPVEYQLYRPTEELRDSRPRAHWALVRNAAKYWFKAGHLSWESIQERRDKRNAYFRAWEKYRWGFWEDEEEGEKWKELIDSIHPDDNYLWRCVAQFKQRREPVHSGYVMLSSFPVFRDDVSHPNLISVSCDNCSKYALASTRIVCIECSQGENSQTLDLCSDCHDKEPHGLNTDKAHKSSHPMVQFRWPPLRIEKNPIMAKAVSLLQTTAEDSGLKRCSRCNKGLEEKPYWQCVECEDTVLICADCNKLDEKEKLWLIQRKPSVVGVHDWMHTLVLHPKEMQAANEPVLTTEQRLATMEAQFRVLQDSVAARFKSMEEMLEKIMLKVTDPSLAK
ncbi:hypothetical protein V5O48_004854 [Marasmius crinis-equi]|uniref:ZZ-type domain-containing protein n=1 Tax=Marasmius crinis-equi TaxID=585013 RepID=A0ABR3FNX5_9AGAR